MSTCPRCHQDLLQYDHAGISLLKCEKGEGFWFKDETFRQAKQIGFSKMSSKPPAESPSDQPPAESAVSEEESLSCPDCAEPLSAYTYAYSSDIHLYRCMTCKGIWADVFALHQIDNLLAGYKESLEDAKAKALPLMLKVKQQIQQEEKLREEEQKRKKKSGLFTRFFGQKDSKNRKIENIFEEFDSHERKEKKP